MCVQQYSSTGPSLSSLPQLFAEAVVEVSEQLEHPSMISYMNFHALIGWNSST